MERRRRRRRRRLWQMYQTANFNDDDNKYIMNVLCFILVFNIRRRQERINRKEESWFIHFNILFTNLIKLKNKIYHQTNSHTVQIIVVVA
jgi:hypothetical protein